MARCFGEPFLAGDEADQFVVAAVPVEQIDAPRPHPRQAVQQVAQDRAEGAAGERHHAGEGEVMLRRAVADRRRDEHRHRGDRRDALG